MVRHAIVVMTWMLCFLLTPSLYAWSFFWSPKYVKTYPGPAQPRANVALLARMEKSVTFDWIDGRTIENESGFGVGNIELLPGIHKARVVLFSGSSGAGVTMLFSSVQNIQFRVEAGRTYALFPNIDYKKEVWAPVVSEISSSTDKKEKKTAASLEDAFIEYRVKSAPRLMLSTDGAVLVLLHAVSLFSIDDIVTPEKRQSDRFFKFSEGRHSIVAGKRFCDSCAPTRIEFTAVTGRVYALMNNAVGGRFQPWSPCVIDITEEMDNVKENLVGPLTKFLSN